MCLRCVKFLMFLMFLKFLMFLRFIGCSILPLVAQITTCVEYITSKIIIPVLLFMRLCNRRWTHGELDSKTKRKTERNFRALFTDY